MRRPGAAIRRPCPASGRALIAGLVSLLGLVLAGCQSAYSSSAHTISATTDVGTILIAPAP